MNQHIKDLQVETSRLQKSSEGYRESMRIEKRIDRKSRDKEEEELDTVSYRDALQKRLAK